MTALDLLRASLRRWYVVAGGLLLTVVVVASLRPQTVFWVSQVATLEPPADSAEPKRLGQPSSDPIPTAEMLAALVNRQSGIVRSRNAGATLYGEGYIDASSARTVNAGSQWVVYLQQPSIQVESVRTTAEAAVEGQRAELKLISSTLEELQDRFAVEPKERITLAVSPSEPSAEEITGARSRAGAAAGLVGIVLTFWAVYVLERRGSRRAAGRRHDG